MTMQARLDKSGRRVLCGVIDCGTELAVIAEGNNVRPEFASRSAGGGDGPWRMLVFGPGWRPRGEKPKPPFKPQAYAIDGVWELGARSAKRLAYQGPGDSARHAPRHRTGNTRPQQAGEQLAFAPYDLPVRVKCYRCGSVQSAEPAALRCEANHHGRRKRYIAGVHHEPGYVGRYGPPDSGDLYEIDGPTAIGMAAPWPP